MSKSYLLITPLFFMFSCGSAEEGDSEVSAEDVVTEEVIVEEVPEVINSFLLETKAAGIFIIGEEVPDLPDGLKMRHFVEAELSEEGPGEELTHNVIFNQLEDVVELIMDHQMSEEHHEDKDILEMWVLSNYYETADAISVGSTIEEFEAAYPDAKVWYTYVSDRFILETEALPDVQFLLNAGDYMKTPKGNSDMEMMRLEDFEVGSKIVKIRMY
ncbi:MAG: hypothetical protein ACI857_000701 [Arenicella sp.]|jgi:hypothetical protein